jgi:hypothetical protein
MSLFFLAATSHFTGKVPTIMTNLQKNDFICKTNKIVFVDLSLDLFPSTLQGCVDFFKRNSLILFFLLIGWERGWTGYLGVIMPYFKFDRTKKKRKQKLESPVIILNSSSLPTTRPIIYRLLFLDLMMGCVGREDRSRDRKR